jgi:hypothetical protein
VDLCALVVKCGTGNRTVTSSGIITLFDHRQLLLLSSNLIVTDYTKDATSQAAKVLSRGLIFKLKRSHSVMTNIDTTTEATKAMENLTVDGPPAPKGTAKRDALRVNEIAVQQKWEAEGVFEGNPQYEDDGSEKESFMVTFPYPYSNGHLHIGHAFSLTKAIFRAQFERHQGKNVLFPFAFHCTGMPIQAVRKQIN